MKFDLKTASEIFLLSKNDNPAWHLCSILELKNTHLESNSVRLMCLMCRLSGKKIYITGFKSQQSKMEEVLLSDWNIPEVFWLKLMALDAHDDGLMSIDGFPVNLKREKQRDGQTGLHMQRVSHISLLLDGP